MNTQLPVFALISVALLMALVSIRVPLSGEQPARRVAQLKSMGSPVISTLGFNEQTHLEFIREEGKLARDVYITLGTKYPQLEIFGKIDESEQHYACSICDLLQKYGVDDPNTNDKVGIYTGESYGPYFTRQYAELVERGSRGVIEALYVGAFIEELNMIDIAYCPSEIIDHASAIGSETDCGKIYTDKADIQQLYTSLLEGSKSHLRAFVRNIERMQGEGTYSAQVLSQDVVNQILDR